MNGISTGIREKDERGVPTGVTVEIDSEKISHVNSLLRSMPEKALTVYERAIRRGLAAGRTQASKEIRTRYDISDTNLRKDTTLIENVHRDESGVAGYIYFSGAKIPLYRFHPSPKNRKYTTRYVNGISGWRVTTDVSAADNRGEMLRRRTAFIATFQSGHTGIFSRTSAETSTGKPELREWWGYSVADMLDYEPAREAIQERAAEIIQKRIDHELLRALDEMK